MRIWTLALAGLAACLIGQPAFAVCVSLQPGAFATVAALGADRYQYAIDIVGSASNNTSCAGAEPTRQVADFYIPYFGDMGIDFAGADFSGTYASYDVEPDTIFGLGGEVLHYHFGAPGTGPFGVSQRVEFDAAFAGAEAPFESGLDDARGNRTVYRGDPLVPGSPELLAALGGSNAAPEPSALALFFPGLLALLGLRRKRAAPALASGVPA